MKNGLLTLSTAPADTVVSLDEAKAHLRVDHADEDSYITTLINAAACAIDGRDGWLGRALVTQVWELHLDSFYANKIEIPLPPLQSIESITYVDAAGDVQTLDAALYEAVQHPTQPYIIPIYGSAWPAAREKVIITFTAGYGNPSDIPALIRQYVLLSVGDMYQHREHAVTGTIIQVVPAFRQMLNSYRVW